MSGLFTVLIAEKEHIDAIQQENKLFFEPFLNSKDLAFCYWNPQGQTLQEAVPGLLDAVGRKKEWRAVIINNCTIESSKTQNPFDIVDSTALKSLVEPNRQPKEKESLEDWVSAWENYYENLTRAKEIVYKEALERPFTKLSTWLCFRPEDYINNEVQEKQDVHDWAMKELEKDNLKPSVKLELLEREQYKRELRMKERIRKVFLDENYLNIAYPKEVHCISPRAAENNYFNPDTYWNVRQESEYSLFADRNMYFDRMRFMVFDMLSYTHRNFRTDYIRFLASILIFISNPIPGSAMQARRLYQLEAETDDAPLCTLVTSYDKKLAATFEVIENEMEKIKGEIPADLTDKAAEALFCTSKDVVVLLDESCDTEKVIAEKDYGFFYDSPENEHHKWNNDYNVSQKALAYIAKQRARAVKKSVGQMQAFCEISDVNISRLTPLQIEDIKEYTNAAEDTMVASIPSDLTDVSAYTQRLSTESEKVKKVINRRMTKKTVAILSAICLGLYLICFLPFLFSNNNTAQTVITAIGISCVAIGAMAIILFVCLFFLRSSVLNAVRNYNNTAREVLGDINSALEQFSKYLSASYNVRRGHAVQNYAHKNLDEYTKSLRVRKKHQEDIRKKRALLLEGYGDYFGGWSFCDETMARPYDYDFDIPMEYTYPAPFLAGDERQIEFISNGNFVTVPSSYITKILVRMEGIYEN